MKDKILKLFKLSKENENSTSVVIKGFDNSIFVDVEKFRNALNGLDPSDKVKIDKVIV